MIFDKVIRDGHIHSSFCPHGTDDDMEIYVLEAIRVGLEEMSFTEHLPYPEGFIDPSPDDDSVMLEKDFVSYVKRVRYLKDKYKDDIKINLGFEIDYIPGMEKEVRDNLEKYVAVLEGLDEEIEDSILSVHAVYVGDKLHHIDYDTEVFSELIDTAGGIEDLYEIYYRTVLEAVKSDLGDNKPKRIGHINLVRKFCKAFPFEYSDMKVLDEIFSEMSKRGYELDYNVSGKRKEFCGEIYVDGKMLELAKEYEIPLVFGSDSHTSKTVGK